MLYAKYIYYVICFYFMFLFAGNISKAHCSTCSWPEATYIDGLLAICIKILALYSVILYDFAFIYLNHAVQKGKTFVY